MGEAYTMNIVGSGMVASGFISKNVKFNDVIIFASGVSNSNETDVKEFDKEYNLLKKFADTKKRLVYISSCIVNDSDLNKSPYSIHKKNMEKFIENNFKKYLIFRAPQLVGFTKNKNTILEHMYRKILSNELITIWKNAYRSLLDIDDFALIVIHILENDLFLNTLINLAPSKSLHVLEILKIMETVLNKKSKIKVVDKSSHYICNNDNLDFIYRDLQIIFNETYPKKVIHKYFSNRADI